MAELTTKRLRTIYIATDTRYGFGYDNREEVAAEFDAWLAAHDAQVKAEALREAAAEYRVMRLQNAQLDASTAFGYIADRIEREARP